MTAPPEISVACPGACCSVLTISGTYEDLLRGRESGRLIDAGRMIDLLVPVDVGDDLNPFGAKSDGVLYECRAFDRATGRCGAYAERPNMCSAYPYDRTCEWCTYDPAHPDAPVVLRPLEEIDPAALRTGIFHPGLLETWLEAAAR